jgi:hypothetical protein
MNKIFTSILLLTLSFSAIGQVIGTVDKKTKEFYIAADQKMNYTVFGYQFANITTSPMICFSSNADVVHANYSKCSLGSYFDTGKMNAGDHIFYLGGVGIFGKMSYVSGGGKKTIFYLPKTSWRIK